MSTPTGALHRIGPALEALLTSGDEKIVCSILAVGPYAEIDCSAIRPDGEYETPRGHANSPRMPDEIFAALDDLRDTCHQNGKGTWFGVVIIAL